MSENITENVVIIPYYSYATNNIVETTLFLLNPKKFIEMRVRILVYYL